MIELAERLGGGTDFVRVDLYDLLDRIVFGELSSFPAAGDSPFEPETFNLEFRSPLAPAAPLSLSQDHRVLVEPGHRVGAGLVVVAPIRRRGASR